MTSSKKTSMDIFATIATKVVTIVGIASYTSGLQKWNGAADILNRNPTDIIKRDTFRYRGLYQASDEPSIAYSVPVAMLDKPVST